MAASVTPGGTSSRGKSNWQSTYNFNKKVKARKETETTDEEVKVQRQKQLEEDSKKKQQSANSSIQSKLTAALNKLKKPTEALIDVVSPNTAADVERRRRAGLPDAYQQQSLGSRLTRALETSGRSVARAAQGIGQDVGGAYDLLTPGKGTNRVTKLYKERGAQTDQQVRDMNLDERAYRAGQVPATLVGYVAPSRGASAVGKIPSVARTGGRLTAALDSVPGLSRASTLIDDLALSEGRLGRTVGKVGQAYKKPSNLANIAADTLQNAGHRTSLDQKNTPGTLAADAGLSLGIQGGLGLLEPGARAARRGLDTYGELGLDAPSLERSVEKSVRNNKATRAKDEFVQKAFNNLQFIEKPLKGQIDEATGRKKTEVIRELAGNVRQSSGLATARRAENRPFQELGVLAKQEGLRKRGFQKELSSFISAKQDAINANKLGNAVEVPIGTPAQERAYQLLNQATNSEVQYAYDNGLIDEAKYKKWMGDADYTRVQREMEDAVRGTGSAEASLSSTVTGQRLKGSDRKAIDPLAAYVDWSNRITREAEVNKFAKYVTDQYQKQGIAVNLRNAADVIKRMELYGEAAQLRPLRNKLGKALKTQSKYTGRLEAELSKLNEQGLTQALKKQTDEVAVPILSGKRDVLKGAETTFNSKRRMPELSGTVETEQFSRKLTNKETKSLVDSLIATDDRSLEMIKRKIAAREPKAAQALDELTTIKKDYLDTRNDVREIINRARTLSDESVTGKATLSQFTNGIKEIYETDPRIVESIKNMDRVEWGALNKFINFPARALKAGATGFNVAFTVPNYLKDQKSSFNVSKNAFSTHNPLVVWEGLKEAALKPIGKTLTGGKAFKPSKEFQEYLKRNSHMTSVDLVRDLKSATAQAYEELGLKRQSPIRTLENVISATETATRYQNWLGTYKKALKKGIDPEEAIRRATQAARENSVDFSQRGELANFMRVFNPYLPASFQGSRTIARAFKERPVATAMKVGATVVLPVATATYANLSDPKKAEIYANIPEYERDKNLIFVLDNGGYLKAPLPPGLDAFTKPLRNLIESEYLGDRQGFLETAKNILVDPFSPIGTTKNEVLGQGVPQALKPAIEVATNYDFFKGDKIIPQNMLDENAPEDQVFDSTSQGYRDLARSLGNISPLQVKQLVKGYGAGGGESLVENIDAVRKASGADVKTGGRTTPEQLVGRFVGKEGSGEVQRKFYKDYDSLLKSNKQTSKKINDAIADGNEDKARKIAQDYNQKIINSENKFRSTYGAYYRPSGDSDLLETLNKLRIDLSDKSIKSRKSRLKKDK